MATVLSLGCLCLLAAAFAVIPSGALLTAALPPLARALVAPINLDAATALYTFPVLDGRPFVLDLSGQFLWQSCPLHHPVFSCSSPQCTSAVISSPDAACASPGARRCRGHKAACSIALQNAVSKKCALVDLSSTVISLNSTNGHNPTKSVAFPNLVSACAPSSFTASLPSSARGIAGFGPRSKLSLPALLAGSRAAALKRKFAVCLPSVTGASGVLFFGDGPFFLLPPPGREVSAMLSYAPLLSKPKYPNDYFIPLGSIAINQKAIAADVGGYAKLSTVVPYTTLSTPIYKALAHAFNVATSRIPRAKAVMPFEICLNSSQLGSTRVGPPVSPVDLRLGNGTIWTIWGVNMLKQVRDDIICLAFLDGGTKPEHPVVMGTFQIQDNFLFFDLERSRLGFSSTLLFTQTTCENFNFTSSAV